VDSCVLSIKVLKFNDVYIVFACMINEKTEAGEKLVFPNAAI